MLFNDELAIERYSLFAKNSFVTESIPLNISEILKFTRLGTWRIDALMATAAHSVE